MEEVLKESEANLSAILENTTDYVLLSDESASPIYFNSAYAKVTKELLGVDMKPGLKPHTLLPDGEEREFWEECHRRVLAGERFTTEYVVRPEGVPLHYFERSFYPIRENGRVKGFSEVTREITDRRLAEEALRESEERFRRIAERSFDAIFLMDMDGTIKYASPSVKMISGLAPEKVVGHHLSEFVATSHMAAVGRGLALLASGQPVENLQVETVDADGRSRFVEANAVPIMRDGRVVAFQAMARDITERRRAEELLQHAYDEQSRQLRQVAGGLAHDVYNDLFPVSVSLYRLRQRLEKSKDADIERNLKLLALSEDAISRAISLTESVNLYSKMQRDKVGACSDFARVLGSVLEHNHDRVKRVGVQITSSLPADLRIGCAEHQLHPLLNNLLLNALDALEGIETPAIDIAARVDDGRAAIEFRDNGSGIPGDVLPRIFEPFFSTKPRTGTGLGLAIVKRIVDICGGQISVQSVPGEGTTFCLTFPTDVDTPSGASHLS
jgi:PAS domain S-box-containing protein